MAKTRVHDLAKEYGMTSKEMLEHLRSMKIPAKSPSSTLEDAYVSIVRKKLKPILEARAAEIEAARKAEEEARLEAERLAAEKAEQERLEAERRREEERRRAEEARRAAEEARRKEEEARAEEERRRKEEEERNRIRDTAPSSKPVYTSLLDQIAQQQQVLARQAEEEARAKEEARQKREAEKAAQAQQAQAQAQAQAQQQQQAQAQAQTQAQAPAQPQRPQRQRRQDVASESAEQQPQRQRRTSGPRVQASDLQAAQAETETDRGGRGRRRGRRGQESEDRYSRMAREAEQYNREHVLAEAREAVRAASEESTGRRRRRKERRQEQAAAAAEQQRIEQAIANDQDLSQLDTVKVPQGSTVAELAELLGVAPTDIIKRMFLLGEALTMTQSMSDDQIEMVAMDLGRDVKVMTKEEENSFTFYDDPESLKSRPPVVTVMGHVDHGKTSLLDAIRHTGVAAGEAGGITQAIGASQVKINGRVITFIDTPGHETFTAMRARGAKVTDIVILIVAADDGVMPQTVESINHAKAAGVPIIVAVNKIDKAGADPTRVRQELTEYGIIPEEWGGENMFVDISARQKLGIDDLLEAILLQADVLELKANPDTFASGNVLEAKLDRGRGSVATVLVTRGTLRVGDALVAGMCFGKVRAMLDHKGRNVKQATPSYPVEILGLQSVPMAGDEFRVFPDERDARNLADERALKARIEEQNKVKHVTLENLFATMEAAEVKELNLIIKADVMGSIEALKDSLEKMDQSEVRINVIHSAVGAINETDVTLADASNAIIIGFGVRPDAKARNDAEHKGVEIRTYDVIYKAMEDIDAARIGMLKPTEVEVQTGIAIVLDTFKVPKVGIAAGVRVEEGEIANSDSVRLVRDGIVVYNGKIASLRHYKEDVKSLRAGLEGGMGLENFQDIHPGDVFEAYRIDQIARTE